MDDRNRILPFWLTPAAWLLKGQARKEARAKHLYEGKALAEAIIEIRITDPKERALALLDLRRQYFEITPYEHDLAAAEIRGMVPGSRDHLHIQWRHNRLSTHDYELALAKLDHPDENSREYKLAVLTADHNDGRVSDALFAKTKATLNDEPWIDIVDHGFDMSQGVNGIHFEFDWNSLWIDLLRGHGYEGATEQDIVEQWFAAVCREQIGDEHLVVDPDMAMLIPMERYRKDQGGNLRS